MAQRYRFVDFDRRDETLSQFYIREVNAALYMKLTRVNARILARLQSADFTQEDAPTIEILDGVGETETQAAVLTIRAPYDEDFGFRISGVPNPPLVEESLYTLRPDWEVPIEYSIGPDNSKGWSPELGGKEIDAPNTPCLLYTSPSPRDS